MADCDHNHVDDRATSKRLLWALAVIVVFMVVEIVGGVLSGSLALLADAAHMFTDALALALAAAAQGIAARPANQRFHFGYRRAQILAAFANGIVMVCLLGWILYEAVRRFMTPVEVESGLMFWVAVAGLLANAVAFMILHRPAERNLNMRGAMLHVIGDLVGSVAAIIAAIVIGLTGWMQIDPILSLVVVGLIGVSTFRLLRETSHILLEGAPDDIDVNALADDLAGASPEIRDVHNIQIWQITPEHPRVTLHLSVDDASKAASAITRAKALLENKYNIRQSTIQVDIGGECPDHLLEKDVREAAAIRNHNQDQAPSQSHAPALAASK